MPFEPDKIAKEDVLKAAQQIDSGEYQISPSTRYDVIINDKVYPPKDIMRFAHENATGEYLWYPGGGEPTNKYLKRLGFKIVEKAVGLATSDGSPISDSNNSKSKINNMPLNTILYGPPGTGKTYHTVNKAVAIANPEFNIDTADRETLKAEYERLVKEGQIEFVTFHQSLGYEDFIEGIKPVEPKEGDPFLKYEIKEGIFKRLAERASKVPDTKAAPFSISGEDFEKAGFYKLSLGDTANPDDDQIYSWCVKNGYIALGWGDAIDFSGENENSIQQMVPGQLEKFAAQAINYFIHYIKPGDYVVVTYGNLQFRAIGRVTGGYEYKNVEGLNVHQFRKVDWLLKDVELPYEELYNKQFSQQSIYRLDKKEIKRDFFVKAGRHLPVNDKPKNYVLIIDEINRGNVSQIFGELITLIEDDKRAGKNEALTVTLPYSKKSFSVPANLYLIGTMNTADRSVEALDTALRRRFTFEEMAPDTNFLSPQRMIWQLWRKYARIDWEDKGFIDVEKGLYDLLGTPDEFKDTTFKKDLWEKMKKERETFGQIDMLNQVDFSGVNLQLMLGKINGRLKALLTKDHTIGHAWLMNVYSLADLQAAFKYKILPLLQEFFYNDYAKIGLVMGRSFVTAKQIEKKLFAPFNDELAAEYEDKIIYTLNNPLQLQIKDFQSIY
ncbi:MAG: AAA family ATPase [Bacteroidota bacterium]